MSNNYLFDLIADTSGAISGFENTTSINDSGLVAAIAQSDSLEDLLVGDGETPVINLSNQYSGRFSSGIEINNDNKVVARDGGGFSAIRLWDVNAPGSFSKTIATGAFGNEFVDFENTLSFPQLSNNSESDKVAFLADPKGGSIETALVTFAGEGFSGRDYNEIILSNSIAKPDIADDATVVIKDLGERIVVYDYQLNLTDIVASSFKGFSSVGESPGISDEGGAIVFYGNLTNPGADSTTEGLDPGEGIFVSIETDAGRKIERIAGIAENGILDPGETHEDNNANGEVDPGEDRGLIGSFSTDERDRFGINFNENTGSGNVVFLAKDELGQESIINSSFNITTEEETTSTIVRPQLVAKVGQEASEVLPDLTGNIQDLHIYDPINKSGQVAFWAETTTSEEAVIRANPIRKPVFVLPGIGGSFPQSDDFGGWLLNRGVAPNTLEIDYLANTYDDLIQTLENAGYQQGVDLFVATYDWRLNPGPIDGNIDGKIERSVTELTDNTYEYAVDQLAFWLEESITGWKSQFADLPEAEIPDLDSVDIIAHSTGGLVARSYIQSDGYGKVFTDDNGKQVNLPTINNFISIGVPNRGASQAWRPTQNDFYSRKGLNPVANQGRFLLRTILSSAFEKVTREDDPATITLSGYNDSEFAIDDPNISALEFIEKYVPTLKALSATYPSIDALPNNDSLQTIEEIDPSQRNSLLLDLNNGYDSIAQGTATDPNLFVDDVELATIIYGENENTDDAVRQKDEPKKVLGVPRRTVHPIGNSFARVPDGIWYEDAEGVAAKNTDSPNLQGDGTVPRQSSFGQFENDSRPNLLTQPFLQNTEGQQGNTDEPVTHGGLLSNTDVQKFVLETLGINNVEEDTISTGLANPSAGDAFGAIRNIIFDPVEGFLIDGQGRRLGYTEATGAITEIPGSLWLGSTDGFGFIPDTVDIEGPFQLELTGLGEDYYVSVALETEEGLVGIESEGFLAAGEQLTLDVPVNNPPIIDLNGDADGIDATAPVPDNGNTSSITDSNLTITDAESLNLAGATVTIQNPEDGNFELLGATATGNITVDYDATTNILTLDGTDTIANYQQVLSSVTYTNDTANPDTTPREIEFVIDDGASFNNLSIPAIVNANFDRSDRIPTFEQISDVTVTEGQTASFSLNLDSPASGDITFDYSTEDLEATAGSDYTATSGELTIAAGETTATIEIATNQDSVNDEDTEAFALNLTRLEGATFSNGQTEISVAGYIKNEAGPMIVRGTGGDDYLTGGSGNDTIGGGKGNDSMYGYAGDDNLRGHSDNDSIFGDLGNDSLFGNSGNDNFSGGDGQDLIKGETGMDTISGGMGNDNINGGSNPDILTGGDGNDTIRGEHGGDIIDGGAGSDNLFGGNSGGRDTFVLMTDLTTTERDIIRDFELGTDRLGVSDLSIVNELSVMSNANNTASIITNGSGEQVAILTGVSVPGINQLRFVEV